eukprot:3886224-Pyramimonas_sp.AAC.1
MPRGGSLAPGVTVVSRLGPLGGCGVMVLSRLPLRTGGMSTVAPVKLASLGWAIGRTGALKLGFGLGICRHGDESDPRERELTEGGRKGGLPCVPRQRWG